MDELEVRPAAFNHRFIAYVVDFAPFAAGFLATCVAAMKSPPLADQLSGLRIPLLWAGLYVAYQFLGNLMGGTPGKRLMGLYVVTRADGEKPGILRAAARAFTHLLSYPFFNFGFGVALLHPETRALHDLLTGTVVVEPQPKSKSESILLFLGAIVLLSGLYGAILYTWVLRPTPGDLAAVDSAKEALLVMAQIEEEFKASRGVYSADLGELAEASGDPKEFRSALVNLFVGERFKLQAGNKAYSIEAAARDRRKTTLVLQGPPPTVSSR